MFHASIWRTASVQPVTCAGVELESRSPTVAARARSKRSFMVSITVSFSVSRKLRNVTTAASIPCNESVPAIARVSTVASALVKSSRVPRSASVATSAIATSSRISTA